MPRSYPALLLLLALPCACDDDPSAADAALPSISWKLPERGAREPGGLRKGQRVPPELGRRPRFSRRPKAPGLRCAPDGVLGEWRGAKGLRWIEAKPIAGAKGYSGPKDQAAKLALASYAGGISLVVSVSDDVHLPAKAAGAFGYADAVELELWPQRPKGETPKTVGVHLWLGSFKQLARFDRPKESWREGATQAFGSEIGGGWQIEARLSIGVLTPLPAPKVERLRYRITIHDRDAKGASVPTLRAEGTLKLDPALEVPEAVQRRGSVRLCMADLPNRALWGYRRGWRCSIPYRPHRQAEDDTAPTPGLRFSHARLPKPPMMRFLRERVLLMNYPELRRGVAGLIDMDKDLVSLLRLGIIGAQDPGNPRTRTSDAEPVRLPDGTWAIAVTHAYPVRDVEQRSEQAEAPPLGLRCAGGHRVYLSIIAVRGAPHVTPHKHVPKPDPPPRLTEALRVLLEDCERSRAYDWSISRDRKRVVIRDSVFPQRAAQVFVYDAKRGIYQRRAPRRGASR
jgi:hypothetical protein